MFLGRARRHVPGHVCGQPPRPGSGIDLPNPDQRIPYRSDGRLEKSLGILHVLFVHWLPTDSPPALHCHPTCLRARRAYCVPTHKACSVYILWRRLGLHSEPPSSPQNHTEHGKSRYHLPNHAATNRLHVTWWPGLLSSSPLFLPSFIPLLICSVGPAPLL